MEKILIKNIRIPDPDTQHVESADILFIPATRTVPGRILDISHHIDTKSDRVIEGDGDYLLPCFVDLASGLCEPGNEHRETIETGTLAAYFGGYGDVLMTPDTRPFPDNAAVLSRIASVIEKKAHCRVHRTAALSIGGQGIELCDLDTLWKEGVKFFTDGLEHKLDHRLLREAMKMGYPIMLSPVRDALYPDSVMTEGKAATVLGVEGEPVFVEEKNIAEYLLLSEETGCPIHIRNISAKGSVEMIRFAKSRGVKVSCSTSPWYFSLTDDDMVFIGVNAKVYPPLRSAKHRTAIIEGLRDGTIDCIDSGHTPLSLREKAGGIRAGAFGAIGLQSVLPSVMTYLVGQGHIDIFRLIELMSIKPAEILGLVPCCKVDENCSGFNLVSLTEEFVLTGSYLKSRSANCPYVGMSLCGRVRNTFVL